MVVPCTWCYTCNCIYDGNLFSPPAGRCNRIRGCSDWGIRRWVYVYTKSRSLWVFCIIVNCHYRKQAWQKGLSRSLVVILIINGNNHCDVGATRRGAPTSLNSYNKLRSKEK